MNLTRTTKFKGDTDIVVFLDMPYLVDADYVRDFMTRYKLIPIGLSSVLKVSTKKIDKWLSGEKPVNATAATLMQLIDQIPHIIDGYRKQVEADPSTEFRFNIC